MKKKALFVVLFMVASVASFQLNMKREKMDGLMLENIEALASGESDGIIYCFGLGSVDCPGSEVKVYFVKRVTY
ncbi:MAG: NVEALA domain-containing protein [Bacteroides sp.]|nr:NVEALA domain-containing protein [Bacteroides sp.]